MQPKIAVGLESTLDILINFPELEDFKEFSRSYDGELSPYLIRGYETLSAGSGGEIPIDGKGEEARELLELAREAGAEVEYAFGGNGAQEAATLENFGCDAVFLGGIFPKSFSFLDSEKRSNLDTSDTSFAWSPEDYRPSSYIFQATGSNRYILTDGEGRRIDQMRSYIRELPSLIQEIEDSHGDLDALSLVGWQVLFGMGLSEEDYRLTSRVIKGIRRNTDALLFSDAGGIGGLKESEVRRLWKIYSLFDVLSMNEDELSLVSKVLSFEANDEVQNLVDLLEDGSDLKTMWLHSPYYQVSLSSEFSRDSLGTAQESAALAGLYKVENGGYPTRNDISLLRKKRSHRKEGCENKDKIRGKYGDSVRGKELVVTPCYEAESFVSTVGAGDVSAAAYLYSIIIGS